MLAGLGLGWGWAAAGLEGGSSHVHGLAATHTDCTGQDRTLRMSWWIKSLHRPVTECGEGGGCVRVNTGYKHSSSGVTCWVRSRQATVQAAQAAASSSVQEMGRTLAPSRAVILALSGANQPAWAPHHSDPQHFRLSSGFRLRRKVFWGHWCVLYVIYLERHNA